MAKTRTYDLLFKILLIGDSDVGKTGIVVRFADNAFHSTFKITIGVDFKIRTVNIDGRRIKLQIWDTAGQERFHNITSAYYRGAMGIMLVYDVTQEKSFDSIRSWIRDKERNATADVKMILVGNRCDLDDERVVSTERGRMLADEFGINFLEISHKTGYNVDSAFFGLAHQIYHARFHDNDWKLHSVCCSGGDLKDILSVLKEGANPNWQTEEGKTALIGAASKGHTHVVKYLLENTSADVNAKDKISWTACHYAAHVGSLEMMKTLVAHGAYVHCKTNEGKTPLHLAKLRKVKHYLQTVEHEGLQPPHHEVDWQLYMICSSNRLMTRNEVRSLVNRGANPNYKSKIDGQTALMVVTCNGLLEIVKYFVENTAADVNSLDNRGRTGLMLAVANGHTETVKYLVENTAIMINVTDDMFWTACHYAVDKDHLEIVKLLVAHGANIHLGSEGRTPFDLAKLQERKTVVEYMNQEIADVTQLYTQAVEKAMRDGVTCVFIIKVLIIGAPGSGKTSLRYLLLDLPPPPKRNSTPLASRAVRAISMHRVKADDCGTINTWKELDDESYLSFIAEEVKVLEQNLSPTLITAQPSHPFTSTVAENNISQSFSSQEVCEREVDSLQDPCSSAVGSQESDNEDSDTPLPSMVHNLVENMVSSPPTIPEDFKQKKTFVHLIDSGGQPSFVSLVPAFVRGSTVNIVVSKYNRSINDKLQYEYVKDDQHLRKPTELEHTQLESFEELVRTLSSVKHSEEGIFQKSSEPKFLLVGTHADKHLSLVDEASSVKNKRLKESLGELKSMCIEVSPDGDILLPINTRVKKRRSKKASILRQMIIKACSNAEVDIPTRWYLFELEVSGMAKKEGRTVLGLAECVTIGKNLRMTKDDVIAALMFLDDAALCMFFKDATPHLVFTDPQTILSEVTEILNLGIIDLLMISSFYPLLSDYMISVRRLREQGLFSKELVDVLCSEYRVNVAEKCVYTIDDFLAILKHLLIVSLVHIDEEELFFIPTILPRNKKTVPGLAGELPPLVFLCRTKVIPLGLFAALVVALLCNPLFTLHEIICRDVISFRCTSGGVAMLVEHHACLVVHFNGDPSVAPLVRAAIHRAIAKVCEQRHLDTSKIVFTDGFWCPFKKCESIPHPCEVNVSTGWLTCSVRPAHGSGRCTNEGMLSWLAAHDKNDSFSVDSSSTAKSLNSQSLSTGVSHEISLFQFIESVAAVIPDKWKRVGVALGLSGAKLNSIDKQHRGDPLNAFTEVFSTWQQLATPDNNPVKWSTLVRVLNSRTVGEEALAESIKSKFIDNLQHNCS